MIRKNMARRLSSKKGESLTELLAALLVASLGLTMFASALTASKHMMELGQKKMDAYYTGRNTLEEENTPDQENQTLSITDAENGASLNIGISKNGTVSGSYNVDIYGGNSGSTQIWRYKRSE